MHWPSWRSSSVQDQGMLSRAIILFALLAVVVAPLPVCAQQASPQRDLPQLRPSRQSRFTIPFSIPKAEGNEPAAREIQLYISTDQGRRWQLAQKATPENRGFPFQAPRDGEYWFAIRSIDSRGQSWPQGVMRPGLRVLVDTEKPSLELDIKPLTGGEVEVRWHAADASLLPESLKLDYQMTGGGPWQPISVPTSSARNQSGGVGGIARFRPLATAKNVAVRAEVVDRTGNRSVVQQLADLNRQPPQQDDNRGAPRAAPLDRPEPRNAAPRNDRFVQDRPPQLGGVGSPPNTDGSIGWPADRTSPVPFGSNRNVAVDNTLPQVAGRGSAATDRFGLNDRHSQVPAQPLEAEPRVTRQVGLPGGEDRHRENRPQVDGPSGIRPLVTRSSKLEMDYQVNLPPAELDRVDLWMSHDEGRTWIFYGSDDDRQSPFVVTMQQDGAYGFRIVPVARGAQGIPPASGQPPENVVVVDRTSPDVRLISADSNVPRAGGVQEVDIRWQAGDAQLAARAVSLYFSPNPVGPWQPIAVDIDNTSQFTWRPSTHQDRPIYLRVIVRDEAGNVGEVVSNAPLQIGVRSATGSIQGIRAVDN